MSDFGLDEGAPRDFGFCPDRLGRISRAMDAAVEARRIPGTVTVVARGGKIVHSHVAGSLDIDREAPLGADSLFRMYSQTKPITAAVALTLFEEGAFFLDDPIAKWLPEFADMQVETYLPPEHRPRGSGMTAQGLRPASRPITIFDLLTMTSGLPSLSRTPANYWPMLKPAWEGSGFAPDDTRINDPVGSYEDMVLALARNPLFAQPGETWNYGSDFDVLSLLLARLTGKDLDTLFRERILDPLGMTSARFYCRDGDAERLVTDHMWDASGNLVPRDRPETAEKVHGANRGLMSGNGLFGGLLCTPADYTRFAQMLLNGGELDGVRVLGRKTVELMRTNHIGDRTVDIAVGPGYGFGLGVCVRKSIAGSPLPGSPGAFGWGGAAGTWFFVDPVEDLIGLFFTSVFGYQFLPTADLADRFSKMAYEALV